MKGTELMIGDIVRVGEIGFHKGSIARVRAICLDSNYISLFDTCVFEDCEDDVEPVLITDDFLEKNEFRPHQVDIDKDGSLIGKWWHKDGLVFVKKYYLSFNDCYCYTIGGIHHVRISNLIYVHQLQQACRLLSIEINWKL